MKTTALVMTILICAWSPLTRSESVNVSTIFAVEGLPGSPLDTMISAFGPRNPCKASNGKCIAGQTITGTRFHEGIDLAATSSFKGKLIIAKGDGVIKEIKIGPTINHIFVDFNGKEFGFKHIFPHNPTKEDKNRFIAREEINDTFVLLRAKFLILKKLDGLDVPLSARCNVILNFKQSQMFVDQNCPADQGSVVFLDGRSWRVTNRVIPEARFAVIGDSGASGRPHIHLEYRVAGRSRNPLSVISHTLNGYASKFVQDPGSVSSLANADVWSPADWDPQPVSVVRSESPTFIWINVDFSSQFDLDTVEFGLDGSAADQSYSLGGAPNSARTVAVGDVAVGDATEPGLKKVYARPTPNDLIKGRRKHLAFSYRLPANLPFGTHKVSLTLKSASPDAAPIASQLEFIVPLTGIELTVNGSIIAIAEGLAGGIRPLEFFAGSPGNTCGGEQGGPVYSGIVNTESGGAATLYPSTISSGAGLLFNAFGNRRPCSAFLAIKNNENGSQEVWANVTERRVTFSQFGSTDREYQVRFYSGNGGNRPQRCEAGSVSVPFGNFFASQAGLSCTYRLR